MNINTKQYFLQTKQFIMYPEEFVDDFRRFKAAMDNTRYGIIRCISPIEEKVDNIKIGSNMIYIPESYYEKQQHEKHKEKFTIGKVYKVVGIDSECFLILDDKGTTRIISKSFFKFHSN